MRNVFMYMELRRRVQLREFDNGYGGDFVDDVYCSFFQYFGKFLRVVVLKFGFNFI